MILRDEIVVQAEPAEVWAALSDPNLIELWNPKCLRSEAGDGPFRDGSRFTASFAK